MTNLETGVGRGAGRPVAEISRPFEFEKYVQRALYVAGWVGLVVALVLWRRTPATRTPHRKNMKIHSAFN